MKALEMLLVVGKKDGVRNDSRLHVMRNIDSDIDTLETEVNLTNCNLKILF